MQLKGLQVSLRTPNPSCFSPTRNINEQVLQCTVWPNKTVPSRSVGTRFGDEVSYFGPGPQGHSWEIFIGLPVCLQNLLKDIMSFLLSSKLD
jgi:hypothetical protein